MDLSLIYLQEMGKDREAWSAALHEGGKDLDTTERLNNNSSEIKVVCGSL